MGMILQHELYGPGKKYVKFHEGGLSAIDAANTAAKLPLNNIRVQYDQILTGRLVLPKNASAVPVNARVLGEATTLLVVKLTYDSKNKDLSQNFVQYRLGEGSTAKYTCTDVLMLTGTVDNPVPPLALYNPSKTYNVQLEVMTCTTQFDAGAGLPGVSLLLSGLLHTDVRSADQYTTSVYKNELVEMYFSNVVLDSVEHVGDKLFFDDPAVGRVALQFVSPAEALQALSKIKWVLDSPETRVLTGTTPADSTAPVVLFKPAVASTGTVKTARLLMPASGAMSKETLIANLVSSCTDDRDGVIPVIPSMLVLRDHYGMTLSAMTEPGTYNATIEVSDNAGNTAVSVVGVVVQVAAVSGPVIRYSEGVTGDPMQYTFNRPAMAMTNVVNKQQIVDALVVSCTDYKGAAMTLSPGNITITSVDSGVTLSEAAYPGSYEVYIDVTDLENNTTSAYIAVSLVNVVLSD